MKEFALLKREGYICWKEPHLDVPLCLLQSSLAATGIRLNYEHMSNNGLFRHKVTLAILTVVGFPVSAIAQRGLDESDLPTVNFPDSNPLITVIIVATLFIVVFLFLSVIFLQEMISDKFERKYRTCVFKFTHENIKVPYTITGFGTDYAPVYNPNISVKDSFSQVNYDRFVVLGVFRTIKYGRIVKIRGFVQNDDGSIMWRSGGFVRYQDIELTDELIDPKELRDPNSWKGSF